MSIGALTERVAFDRPTVTPDGKGGQEVGWAQQFLRWARFIYQRGGEEIEAARIGGRSIYKVKVRSSAQTRAITPAWRMRDLRRGAQDGAFPGEAYNVREVDAITDRGFVYLVVEGGVEA